MPETTDDGLRLSAPAEWDRLVQLGDVLEVLERAFAGQLSPLFRELPTHPADVIWREFVSKAEPNGGAHNPDEAGPVRVEGEREGLIRLELTRREANALTVEGIQETVYRAVEDAMLPASEPWDGPSDGEVAYAEEIAKKAAQSAGMHWDDYVSDLLVEEVAGRATPAEREWIDFVGTEKMGCLTICTTCWAVVPRRDKNEHRAWHAPDDSEAPTPQRTIHLQQFDGRLSSALSPDDVARRQREQSSVAYPLGVLPSMQTETPDELPSIPPVEELRDRIAKMVLVRRVSDVEFAWAHASEAAQESARAVTDAVLEVIQPQLGNLADTVIYRGKEMERLRSALSEAEADFESLRDANELAEREVNGLRTERDEANQQENKAWAERDALAARAVTQVDALTAELAKERQTLEALTGELREARAQAEGYRNAYNCVNPLASGNPDPLPWEARKEEGP